ncbi:MAG: hypothetical protein GPJ54_01030 [Candidatus Heimdallarchaeota archaeon]|nr:hypothetical protein [Candidatus Heimdallarchaeota archaeon]
MSRLYRDYDISHEALLAEFEKPLKIGIAFFSLVVIGINIAASYFLYSIITELDDSNVRLTFSISFSIMVFIMGLIGGLFWQKMGLIGARATYAPFVHADKKRSWISRLYIRFFESDSEIFLEGQAKDRRLKGPLSIGPLIFRISISQMGFYITATAFIIGPIISRIRSYSPLYQNNSELLTPLLTLGVSTIILGMYIPLTIVLEDSNLRSFDPDNRFIHTPGSSFRSRFDAVVGIGALTSGWSIFTEFREGLTDQTFVIGGDSTILMTLDYIAWLGFILMLSWPLIAPASMYYFLTLEKSINKFRSEAIIAGIPIGVSNIRPPKETEIINIASFIRTLEGSREETEK